MPDMMNAKDIAFPHLGIYIENLPKSFSIFTAKRLGQKQALAHV